MLSIIAGFVQFYLMQRFLFQPADGVCPIPGFFHGDFFSIERGAGVDTVITAEKFESQTFSGECHDVEQIQESDIAGVFHARILYLYRNSDCYACHEMYYRTPNVLQVKKSDCIASSTGDFADVCSGIVQQNEVVTMFRKFPEIVNCNETFNGVYQFSYEVDVGGGGFCHNRSSVITACQVPDSAYLDNQIFRMRFASCPGLSSMATDIRFQCLGTWKEGSKVFSAVTDTTDSVSFSRFRCLLTKDDEDESNIKHFTMSRWSECSTLNSEYDGPFRLVLHKVFRPKDDGCGIYLDIEGATRNASENDSVSYTCEDGMYFDDQNMTKEASCECRSINEVLSWGICSIPPPVTPRPDNGGPRIISDPVNALYSSTDVEDPFFQCTASGYPKPTYEWLVNARPDLTLVRIDPDENDDKFHITEGILTILYPEKVIEEFTDFVCLAKNKYGAVRSKTASVILAFINDFPKSQRDPYTVQAYHGLAMECNAPYYQGYTALMYGWYKDSVTNILRPADIPYIFISLSGKLYFSHATLGDSGNYHCLVSPKESDIMKSSMPIQLQVLDSLAAYIAPEIASGFPATYPLNILLNDNVTLECFAYGTSQLYYMWAKQGGSLPTNSVFSDWNRTLTIVNIQKEDAGTYTCSVTDNTDQASGSVLVEIQGSVPYFVEHLVDQYVTNRPNAEVTLSGTAEGDPPVSYVWFKNGTEITEEVTANEPATRYTIAQNVLHIQSSDFSSVTGMYQLQATNFHGSSYSTAQVWELEPVNGAHSFSSTNPALGILFSLISFCLFYHHEK